MDDLKLAAQSGATAAAENVAEQSREALEETGLARRLGASLSLDGSKRQNFGFGGGAHGTPREKKRQ